MTTRLWLDERGQVYQLTDAQAQTRLALGQRWTPTPTTLAELAAILKEQTK